MRKQNASQTMVVHEAKPGESSSRAPIERSSSPCSLQQAQQKGQGVSDLSLQFFGPDSHADRFRFRQQISRPPKNAGLLNVMYLESMNQRFTTAASQLTSAHDTTAASQLVPPSHPPDVQRQCAETPSCEKCKYFSPGLKDP